MRSLAQLFGPRIETRLVSTISLIVTIALMSLIVVVSVKVRSLQDAAMTPVVQLTAQLAQASYPDSDPGFAAGHLPPAVLQVSTRGGAGEVHTRAPSLPALLPVPTFRPGMTNPLEVEHEGKELRIYRVVRTGAAGELESWVLVSGDDLDWRVWVVVGQLLLVGAAILISCYFLGIFLGRALLAPLERFTACMREIRGGSLQPILVPEAPANFGEFQAAFNLMLEQLRKNQEMERALLAQDKMATVGQLASAVAHETRNPLAAISSLTQILAEEVKEDPRLRKYTKVVLKEVARLDENITHLLEYARPMRPRFAPTPIGPLIQDVVVLLGFEARRRGLVLTTEVEAGEDDGDEEGGGGPRWPLDGNQLKQVLVNLTTNALKACPVGSRIELGARREGGELLLWVEDDGPGVPPELAERIFQPFYSVSRGGTGLGLAVARRIVDSHCGRIWVEPGADGRGARFAVRLPELDGPPAPDPPETVEGPSPWPKRS